MYDVYACTYLHVGKIKLYQQYLNIVNIYGLMSNSLISKAECRIWSSSTGKFTLFHSFYQQLPKMSVATCFK